ncbi:MAG: helix-turn-helix transcriptional regulator [Bacteroidota bacterium]
MINILADNDFILDVFNPAAIASGISGRMRERRLEMNLTQQNLAKKSGVSLGTLKRFERNHEISLKHLLMLAVVLDATEEFALLFSRRQFENIDQALEFSTKKRQRGKNNE